MLVLKIINGGLSFFLFYQFIETKKYCGDFGERIEAVTAKTSDTVDIVESLRVSEVCVAE